MGVSFIFMSPNAPVTITSCNSKCLKNISVESGKLCAAIGNTNANDKTNNIAKVIAAPQRDDIDLPIEEHLIVELYSK